MIVDEVSQMAPEVRVIMTFVLASTGPVFAVRAPHLTMATISPMATVGEVCREIGTKLTTVEWQIIREAYGWPDRLPVDLLKRRWPPPPPGIRSRLIGVPDSV